MASLHLKLKIVFLPLILYLSVAGAFYAALTYIYPESLELKPYVGDELILGLICSGEFFAVYIIGCILLHVQNKKLGTLNYYKSFIIIIIILLFANVGLLAYSIKNLRSSQQFKKDLNETVTGKDNKLNLTNLHFDYKCCGFNGPKDFDLNKIPQSCCIKLDQKQKCPENLAYHKGCFWMYVQKFEFFKFSIFIGISISLGMLMGTIILYFCFTLTSS